LVVEFARASRREMMHRTLESIHEMRADLNVDTAMASLTDINHNYVDREEHFSEYLFVHRKGAIRVGLGETGFVPGSMGTSSYVVEGRGNEFAFCSCAHGGGRTMSRAEASRTVTRRDYEQSLQNVVCAHAEVLLDEAPEAYKDIKVVMRGQSDLVKTIFELHPVLSLKGR
jgi:tRNA-splicing ligase RtcB (3'-phosphate/5'-hydroxy nucleic acid ligase)